MKKENLYIIVRLQARYGLIPTAQSESVFFPLFWDYESVGNSTLELTAVGLL